GVLADSFLQETCALVATALSPRRRGCGYGPLRKCFDYQFLHWHSSAEFARTHRQYVVWLQISRRATCVGDGRLFYRTLGRHEACIPVDRSGTPRALDR